MRKISAVELDGILEKHKKWIIGKEEGEKSYLVLKEGDGA